MSSKYHGDAGDFRNVQHALLLLKVVADGELANEGALVDLVRVLGCELALLPPWLPDVVWEEFPRWLDLWFALRISEAFDLFFGQICEVEVGQRLQDFARPPFVHDGTWSLALLLFILHVNPLVWCHIEAALLLLLTIV